MKTLIRVLFVFSVAALALGVTACGGDKDSKTSIKRRNGRYGPGSGPGLPGAVGPGGSGQSYSGKFVPGSYTQGAWDDFFAGSSDPYNELGWVDPNQEPGAGVLMTGQLQGVYSTRSQAQSSIQGGQVIFWVKDSIGLATDQYQFPQLGQAQGQIYGSQVQFTVADEYGQVSFNGAVDGSGVYRADVTFQNTQHVGDDIYQCSQGSSPCAGHLGQVEIPICDLLQCQ